MDEKVTSSAATALAFLNSTRMLPLGGAAYNKVVILVSTNTNTITNTNMNININTNIKSYTKTNIIDLGRLN